MSQRRKPAGTSDGGKFTAAAHPETNSTLATPEADASSRWANSVNRRLAELHETGSKSAIDAVWNEARSQFESDVDAGATPSGSMSGVLAHFENALDLAEEQAALDDEPEDEHEAAHARERSGGERVDRRICQSIGCMYGDH